MSLLVWLPLNGNIENQGIDNISSWINTTATIDNNGKIGKSYKFTATTNLGIYSNDNGFMSKYINNHSFSLCAWVKSTETDTIVISLSFGLRLFAGVQPSINLGNTTRSISAANNKSTADGKWHHLTATYNTTTNLITLYVDGTAGASVKYHTSDTYASNWDNGLFIGRDPNNSTTNAHYFFQGNINDIRIYDHCLSPKEVKEISKGLILHYPMNQIDGVIGGRNLFNLYPGYLKYGNEEYQLANYQNTGSFTQFSNCLTFNPSATVGKTYTISFWAKSPNGATQLQLYNANGSVRYFYFNTVLDYGLGDTWKYYTYTVTNTDRGSSYTTNYNRIEIYAPNKMGVLVKDIKVEEGTKATIFTLPPECCSATKQDNTIYDTSGFGYNGITTSATSPTWDSDSPIGQGTYDFAGNKKIYTPTLPTAGLADSYTITYWAKVPAHQMCWGFSDGNRLNGPYNGLYWNTGDSSSNPFQTPGTSTTITTPSTNIWHHYAITGDGTSSKLYVDGVHYGTAKTYKSITGSQIYINGWNSSNDYNFNGQLNDFRVYTTALSAADIKELYQTRFSLTNNGTFFCGEYIENTVDELNLLNEFIQAGARTAKIDNNCIIIGTGSDVGDTYFYIQSKEALAAGTQLTFSCDAFNVPEGCNWIFLGNNSTASNLALPIHKNGRNYCTFSLGQAIAANTSYLIDDSGGRPSTPPNIILSNFKLYKGAAVESEPEFNRNGNLYIDEIAESETINSAHLYKDTFEIHEIIEN